MKNQKMNNLLVGGKKAVLLAMFAALPLSNVNAVNEQSQEPQTEQTQTIEKLTKSENTRGLIFGYSVMLFLFAGIAVYFYVWDKETRLNKKKGKSYKNLTTKKLKSEFVKSR